MPSFSGGCTTNTKKTTKFFTICKQTHGKSAGMFFVLTKIFFYTFSLIKYAVVVVLIWPCKMYTFIVVKVILLFISLDLCFVDSINCSGWIANNLMQKLSFNYHVFGKTIYAMISISSKISHSHCYKNKMLSAVEYIYMYNMSIHIQYTSPCELYVDRVVGIQQTHNSYSIIESTIVYLLCIKLFKWFIRLIIYFKLFY